MIRYYYSYRPRKLKPEEAAANWWTLIVVWGLIFPFLVSLIANKPDCSITYLAYFLLISYNIPFSRIELLMTADTPWLLRDFAATFLLLIGPAIIGLTAYFA
jgi:hypothetical protein